MRSESEEFAVTLRRAMLATERMTQAQLAERLAAEGIQTTKHTVSLWVNGTQPAKPHEVFAIERALGRPPGSISRVLGYIPVEAKPARTVAEAIDADPQLGPTGRAALHSLYVAMRGKG